MRRSSTILAAVTALAALSSAASAQPIQYRFSGTLTEAQFLSFAVINGNIIQRFPRAGDLPIPYRGQLDIDPQTSFARFSISGSFTSPAFTTFWDVASPNVFDGLVAQSLGGPVAINIANSDIQFSLDLSPETQTGHFSFRDIGAVPATTPRDVLAVGTVTSVSVIPTPGAAALVAAGGVLALARRRRP